MADVMLSLGTYQFSIDTAAYQQFERTTEHQWAEQARFGQGPLLQYTGFAAEKIRLDGVIYPRFRGGLTQLDRMRNEAGKGVPFTLISALGYVLGDFVIEKVTERQSEFAMAGLAQKVEFTLELKRYDNELGAQSLTSRYEGPAATGPYNPGPTPGATPKQQTAQQAYLSKAGDMLDRLVQRHYGTLANRALEKVLASNRGLADIGTVLPPGVSLKLPPLPAAVSVTQLPKLWS
ncbi:phage tail protein [Aquabacterium sp.]|uniref:phage tail protein n=1 Tax=Aquabacterium sp. TaxID=1872578 RepID=UPI003BAEB9A1